MKDDTYATILARHANPDRAAVVAEARALHDTFLSLAQEFENCANAVYPDVSGSMRSIYFGEDHPEAYDLERSANDIAYRCGVNDPISTARHCRAANRKAVKLMHQALALVQRTR